MANNSIVSDHRTLRGLEIAGYIVRRGKPGETSRHWSGLQAKEIRVKPGEKITWMGGCSNVFTHRGTDYRIEYFDGSFHPFVVRMAFQSSKPAFV